MMWMIGILLFLIGLIAGTVGSLAGLGGGVIIVPSILFLSEVSYGIGDLTPAVAVGTSLFLIILTALASTVSFSKQKRVDYKSGWIFFLACAPGTIVGAYLTKLFEVDTYLILFGLLMVFVSIVLSIKERGMKFRLKATVKRVLQDGSGNTYEYGYHQVFAIVFSFIVGMISGMFGIGGGSLLVPMMVLLFTFPPHVATATSMFVILLSAGVGSVAHIVQGNVDWMLVAFLAPGSWLGGKLGAWISARLSSKALLNFFRIVILLLAVRMIADGLHLI
ncbi:sulfite exporter TauE/SafE family protein [Hazenella sp. IB182357]|uniref:Probable membrane transporter protein n=1 Tax=Polycladospora coralii TaxID=2771432 RepID=A0A926NAJ9_9BACL|nr:sulfite exporter TauE/SafE family protein [Polycladospora coralii]MBD1372522.1 sulfite exporter TauE/SafE family protein [Polycladospora coralii]